MHLCGCLRVCLGAHQTTQSTWVAKTMWIGVVWCAAKQALRVNLIHAIKIGTKA